MAPASAAYIDEVMPANLRLSRGDKSDGLRERLGQIIAVLRLSRSAVDIIVVAQARCKDVTVRVVRVGVLLAHRLSWIKAITLGDRHPLLVAITLWSLQDAWH